MTDPHTVLWASITKRDIWQNPPAPVDFLFFFNLLFTEYRHTQTHTQTRTHMFNTRKWSMTLKYELPCSCGTMGRLDHYSFSKYPKGPNSPNFHYKSNIFNHLKNQALIINLIMPDLVVCCTVLLRKKHFCLQTWMTSAGRPGETSQFERARVWSSCVPHLLIHQVMPSWVQLRMAVLHFRPAH